MCYPACQIPQSGGRAHLEDKKMNSIFYIIGVVVVILFVLGYFGLHA